MELKSGDLNTSYRYIGIVAVAVIGLLAGQVWLTYTLINRDRRQRVQEFVDQHETQLRKAIDDGRITLLDMLDSFEFLKRLMKSPVIHHRRGLKTLLWDEEGLMAVSIWDTQGQKTYSRDSVLPDNDFSFRQYQKNTETELFREALIDLTQSASRLGVSSSHTDDSGRILRAFVQKIEGSSHAKYVGVLVNMRRAFDEIQPVAQSLGSEFLVVGPHNQMEPISTLEKHEFTSVRQTSSFLTQISESRNGLIELTQDQSSVLGLSEKDHILSYNSFEVTPKLRWTVGVFTSLAPAQKSARSTMWRISAVSGLVSLILFGIGGFLVYSLRTQGYLQNKLRETQKIAYLHAKSDAILDAIPIGVVTVDEDLEIQELNAEMEVVLGKESTVKGESMERLWQERTSSSFDEVVEAIESDGSPTDAEPILLESVDYGEKPVHFQVRTMPFHEETDSGHTIITFDDVTAIKELESQLLRAEKLSTVGVLTAGVAHEIGTPLNVIRGRADFGLESLEDDHPVKEHLSVIIDQSEYISEIVEQVLGFSREATPETESTDVSDVITRSKQLVEFQKDSDEVKLSLDLDEELPPIAANPHEFQQVIVNLAMNACQACEDTGDVTIAASEADEGLEGPAVRIEVRDTGTGIAPENKHKVFDPFFTTKKRGKGTGLGLAVVQKIVRSHDGAIRLSTTPGEGTTFYILWPIHNAKQNE